MSFALHRRAAMLQLLVAGVIAASLPGSPARAATPPPKPVGDDVRTLIDQVVQAYGGRDALQKATSYRAQGRIIALQQQREAPTVRLYARPDRLRVELQYPEAPETRILSGAEGWRGTGNDLGPANGPMLDAMVLQAARSHVPWTLMERGADARSIDPLERGGRKLTGIELPLREGLVLRAYVDPATHRVEVSQGLLEHGGMSTAFETIYGDFRTVEGLLFPFREENFASGTHTGTTTIDQLEWNPPLRPEDFKPPAPKGTRM